VLEEHPANWEETLDFCENQLALLDESERLRAVSRSH
jgi:hypothetical protein